MNTERACLLVPPARGSRLTPLPTQAPLNLWRILLNPAIDRAVVDRDAALSHHLLEVAVAHAVAALPPHRPEHDLAREVTPLEIRHGPVPPRSDSSRRAPAGIATEPFAHSLPS